MNGQQAKWKVGQVTAKLFDVRFWMEHGYILNDEQREYLTAIVAMDTRSLAEEMNAGNPQS